MKIGTRLWMVAGVCVLAAGCTGSEQPPPPATVTVTSPPSMTSTALPEPDTGAVAWMNGMCGAVFGYLKANNERLTSGPAEEVVTKATASRDLGALAELAGKAATELSALPASPFKEGDKVKQYLLDKFTASRDIATEGKRKVDASKGNAAIEAGSKAMTDAQSAVQEAFNPLGQFTAEEDSFKKAAASAEKCKPTS